ncbi:MAG: hypothetical protein Q8P97_02595 [bacterium]|nr:hypothetical protein [bacterium]
MKNYINEKNIGLKLLEVLRKQRQFFIRTTDGQKIISNHIIYNSLGEEALRLQEKIGAENKKLIIAECKKQGIPVPNFRKEGIVKL